MYHILNLKGICICSNVKRFLLSSIWKWIFYVILGSWLGTTFWEQFDNVFQNAHTLLFRNSFLVIIFIETFTSVSKDKLVVLFPEVLFVKVGKRKKSIYQGYISYTPLIHLCRRLYTTKKLTERKNKVC